MVTLGDHLRIAQLLAQGKGLPQLPHRLLRADVLEKVIEAQVPMDLRPELMASSNALNAHV